jgi:hypothetical protein
MAMIMIKINKHMQEELKTNWGDQEYDSRLNAAVAKATDITNNCESHFETYPTWDQIKKLLKKEIADFQLTDSDVESILDGMAQGYAMIAVYNKQ